MTQPEREKVIVITDECKIIKGYFHGHRGSNDYSLMGDMVLGIVDSDRTELTGSWEPQWTQIAPGIETREESCKLRNVRVHRHACPVKIRMLSYHEYNSYTDMEHCSYSSTT